MGFEALIVAAIAGIVAIFAAFRVGKSKGTTEANSARDRIEIESVAKANREANATIQKLNKETQDVHEEINSLDSGDALKQMREEFSRDSDRDKNN
jgi:cell division protein FtsB